MHEDGANIASDNTTRDTDIVPAHSHDPLWDSTDYRITRRRLDARLATDRGNHDNPGIDRARPLPGDLIAYADGVFHRYAGIGLCGTPVIAPDAGDDLRHTDFELGDAGILNYVGPAYRPRSLPVVSTSQFLPAAAWSWHHDDPASARVRFSIPVRVWAVCTTAPADPMKFGYSGHRRNTAAHCQSPATPATSQVSVSQSRHR